MGSQKKLAQAQFDEGQAKALTEVTITLISASWIPVFEQLQTHTKQLQSLEGQVAELKTNGQNTARDVGELRSDVGELKTGMAELKTSGQNTARDVGELRSDVGELKTGMAELKTSGQNTAEDVGELKTSQQTIAEKLHKDMSKYCGQNFNVSILGFLGVIAAIIGSAIALYMNLT